MYWLSCDTWIISLKDHREHPIVNAKWFQLWAFSAKSNEGEGSWASSALLSTAGIHTGTRGCLGTARKQDVASQHTLVLSFSCLIHTGTTNTSLALSFPHVLLPLSLRHSWDCQVVMQLFCVSHSTQQSRPVALSHTKWCLSNTSQELPRSSQDCFIPVTQGLWNLSRQTPSSLSRYQRSSPMIVEKASSGHSSQCWSLLLHTKIKQNLKPDMLLLCSTTWTMECDTCCGLKRRLTAEDSHHY